MANVKINIAAAAVLAGAIAMTATPSFARNRALVGAGIGFAAGALIGAAAANANSNAYYYPPGYAYPRAYAYEPAYVYAPAYAYAPAYSYGYRPGYRHDDVDPETGHRGIAP